jgi:hypothetical protein
MNLVEKLSSYNFFNYLLPGVLFVVLADVFTKYSFIQSNIVLGLFVYYFIGLVISRFGSLVLEQILKHTGFVQFADYGDFVRASKTDEKIMLLSEVNNTYRTLASLLILLGILRLYQALDEKFRFNSEWSMILTGLLLLFLFVSSYRKQTNYITKRVRNAIK